MHNKNKVSEVMLFSKCFGNKYTSQICTENVQVSASKLVTLYLAASSSTVPVIGFPLTDKNLNNRIMMH